MKRPPNLSSRNILLCIAMLILPVSAAFCQLKAERLKVHVNYNRLEDGHSFGNLAPAVVLKGQKRFEHEFELNKVEKSKDTYDYYFGANPSNVTTNTTRNFIIALRYQFTKNLSRNEEAKWIPQLGFSILPRFQRISNESEEPTVYDRKTTRFGIDLGIVPQLRGMLSKRTFIDLSLPITPFSYQSIFQLIKSPSLPIRQQRNGGIEVETRGPKELAELVHIRLGIGVKL